MHKIDHAFCGQHISSVFKPTVCDGDNLCTVDPWMLRILHDSLMNPKHQVLLQECAVFTLPVYVMDQTIGDWIDKRQPGGYLNGPSRFGRSCGVNWHLKNILEDRLGKPLNTSELFSITCVHLVNVDTSIPDFTPQRYGVVEGPLTDDLIVIELKRELDSALQQESRLQKWSIP